MDFVRNSSAHDVGVSILASSAILAILILGEETARRGIFKPTGTESITLLVMHLPNHVRQPLASRDSPRKMRKALFYHPSFARATSACPPLSPSVCSMTVPPTKILRSFCRIPFLTLLSDFVPPVSQLRPTRCSSQSLSRTGFLFLSSSNSSRRDRALSTSSATGVRRVLTHLTASMPPLNPIAYDAGAAVLVSFFALLLLRFWEEMAKRQVFDKVLNRKLVHISVGLVFMLFWPLFSSGSQAPFLAALAPGLNIIRMLLLGLGIWRNDALVTSLSRHGDYRELRKGPLYYACTITLATSIFWRTSPIAIAAICNLCAGDGVADIIGRRFGSQKLPYNPNKSIAGSIAMACAGFIASVGYMHYFSLFGFVEESWRMIMSFLVVSVATAIVESLPISTELDDNLTVPLTSLLVGGLIF